VQAFQHCVQTFGHQSTWLAMIDNDEFLFSPESLDLREILVDCDEDTILLKVRRLGDGNVCHTGTRTCFRPLA